MTPPYGYTSRKIYNPIFTHLHSYVVHPRAIATLCLVKDSGWAESPDFDRMLIFGSITSTSWVVGAKRSELQKS
jgi:hypothetical protein